jgi:hypothetical protein
VYRSTDKKEGQAMQWPNEKGHSNAGKNVIDNFS